MIVMLLAYDPFIQAIVTQLGQEDITSLSQGASIGTALTLDTGILSSTSSGGLIFWEWTDEVSGGSENLTCMIQGVTQWQSQPDLGMVASVYEGFNNQSSTSSSMVQTVEFTCRTGNCTWSPFASLAVSASCHDVTPNITVSTQPAFVSYDGGKYNGTQTVFSLPHINITNWDAIYSESMDRKKRGDDQARISSNSIIMSVQGTINGPELISFQNSTTFLLGFSMLHADEGYLNGSVDWNASRPYGTECGLELLTNIYSTQVTEGTVTEQVIYSSAQRNMQSLMPTYFAEGDAEECGRSWNQLNNNSLYYDYENSGTSAIDRTDLMLFIPEQDAVKHNISNIPGSGPLSFNISDRTLKSTLGWMKKEFASGQLIWYNSLSQELYEYQEPSFWNQSAVASSLVDRSNLNKTFERVADSMTVWMRNLGYTRNPVYGTDSSWVLHTRVRWSFIAVPIIATLAGCVFCVVVIVETRRLGLHPWRESCLAILAYGINDDLRDRLRRADDDIEKTGRNINIRMRDNESGLGL